MAFSNTSLATSSASPFPAGKVVWSDFANPRKWAKERKKRQEGGGGGARERTPADRSADCLRPRPRPLRVAPWGPVAGPRGQVRGADAVRRASARQPAGRKTPGGSRVPDSNSVGAVLQHLNSRSRVGSLWRGANPPRSWGGGQCAPPFQQPFAPRNESFSALPCGSAATSARCPHSIDELNKNVSVFVSFLHESRRHLCENALLMGPDAIWVASSQPRALEAMKCSLLLSARLCPHCGAHVHPRGLLGEGPARGHTERERGSTVTTRGHRRPTSPPCQTWLPGGKPQRLLTW